MMPHRDCFDDLHIVRAILEGKNLLFQCFHDATRRFHVEYRLRAVFGKSQPRENRVRGSPEKQARYYAINLKIHFVYL